MPTSDTNPGPLHRLVGRILSLFKTNPAPIAAFYSIMVSKPNGFSIQSGEILVKTFNDKTFMPELRSFISERHKVDNFNLITLTFYPPNDQDHGTPGASKLDRSGGTERRRPRSGRRSAVQTRSQVLMRRAVPCIGLLGFSFVVLLFADSIIKKLFVIICFIVLWSMFYSNFMFIF